MMRDLRIPIVLVIPVSIALIGVLWILKKRSGPKGESRKKLAKPKAETASTEKIVEQTKQIDNEGITVTQRKIPETLARDRGSADLHCTGPDIIAGADTREISGGAKDIGEAVEQTAFDHEIHAITSISINSRDFKQISLSEKERPKSPLEDRTQNNSVLDVVELQKFQLENLLSGAKDTLTNPNTVLPKISHRLSESLDLLPESESDSKAVTVSENLKPDSDNALINTQEVFELAHESDPNISQSTAVEYEPASELKSYKDHCLENIELDELKDSSIFSDNENKENKVDDIEKNENIVTIIEEKPLKDALNFGHIHPDKLSAVFSFEEIEPQPVQQSTPVPKASESSACLSSERTCEYKVVKEVLLCKDQYSGHDVSPLVCQKVESGHDLVLIPTDATTELMAFHVNTLSENVSPSYFEKPVNSCDNLAVADVEDVSHLNSSELAICDQSSFPACLSSIKDVTSDSLHIDSVSIGEVHNTKENQCDTDHNSHGDLVVIRDTSKGTLPCDRYSARSSSPPTLASTLNLQNLSTLDPCTDYKINWSSETAADEPLLTDSVITVSDSSFASIQPLPESLSQGLISPDLGVETSDLLQPIHIADKKNLASCEHKPGSPAKSNSPMCDNNSEGSNDSGRGGSEHDVAGHSGETLVHFDFNMPSELCGRFIGKQGKNINFLKSKTGANVSLINNPFTAEYQICQVVGTQAEVDDALAMIRRKFPINEFPLLTMLPINVNPVVPAPIVEHPLIVPEVMQLSLPEGVSVEVFVSAIVDAGHIFVQQPTHRSFMSLEKLTYFLNTVYGQDPNVPCVPTPVEYGIICVCENDGCWYRAMIMGPENEDGETQVKFVDYGGYAVMPVSSLKQIRTDFMSLPFQAVECFMANITPNQGEAFFSEEATMTLSSMTEYKLLQCQVVARTENGIPYIHLYQINPESNSAVMINRALVNGQYVRWIEIL